MCLKCTCIGNVGRKYICVKSNKGCSFFSIRFKGASRGLALQLAISGPIYQTVRETLVKFEKI